MLHQQGAAGRIETVKQNKNEALRQWRVAAGIKMGERAGNQTDAAVERGSRHQNGGVVIWQKDKISAQLIFFRDKHQTGLVLEMTRYFSFARSSKKNT